MALVDQHASVAHIINNSMVRATGHTTASGAIILSWIHVLGDAGSACATMLACAWYAVTLYESETVKNMVARWKAQKILGPKRAAERDAKNKVIVAVDAVAKAAALPVDPPKS